MRKELISLSKFESLVLRHDPGAIGVELDNAGWIDVDIFIAAMQKKHSHFSRELLDEIAATNDKKRFAFSDDGRRIRAVHGHSIGVDLGKKPVPPPAELYHGTADRNLPAIREKGLIPGQRDLVHLSQFPDKAREVGMRHGRPVVLVVDAERMSEVGHEFYLSESGVWLTKDVAPEFLRFPD